ncbi:MAG: DUF917 family protein [Desulfurococcus sp.]|uniref:DUF917 domain-containing protein n=1 Tax=Desulfurococcus sp. TaxID=51678 RepID=UPI003168C5F7
MRLRVDEKIAESIVLGGSFLGGGGGGDIKTGLSIARLALEFGDLYIVSLDELKATDMVVTASLVGAPAAKDKYVKPAHMIRSAELFVKNSDVEIAGFISSENGGTSSTNGWIPASALGIPVVDAPADGRAHPTGVMGSMGLHKLRNYVSIQVAVGGDKEKGMYVEIVARGSLDRVDKLVREAAVQAGGMVAVTRNPVTPGYLEANAAPGALKKAMEIGSILMRYTGDVEEACMKIIEYLRGGSIVDKGVVEDVVLETRGGYDIGKVVVKGLKGLYEITFWNEYMTLEDDKGIRYASFPDLIVTMDIKTSLPKTSAEIARGDNVLIVTIPKEFIPLGSGVKDPDILAQVERVIGKKIL